MRRSCRSADNQAMSNQLDPRPRHARPAFGGRGLFLGLRLGLLVAPGGLAGQPGAGRHYVPYRGLPDPEACGGAVRGIGSRLKS